MHQHNHILRHISGQGTTIGIKDSSSLASRNLAKKVISQVGETGQMQQEQVGLARV